MKRVVAGALIALTVVFVYRSCLEDNEVSVLKSNSMLIERQIKNVSKLIVTEGHFAEVYNYEDSKALFGSLLAAEKRALVVVNAEVTIAYDLKGLEFELDEVQKTVFLKKIPEPEIKINPDFEYYDVSADYFNPFEAADYNTIKEDVKALLRKKLEASPLKSNAQNRLLSELSNILMLTNTLGWKLVHNERPIEKVQDLTLDNRTIVD
ncbi:DUF4230 domain-containing protein [Croceitalea sp. MTPC5]|uniref:DUF4230 domain-containing protein n=1 Tax=Croceitalea sp. MTPC5 TaxID=3056565 RepID=UPI002B3C1816|nr:DUF4230 domain-containing protein [Croceitalea sp. MTPC5]